MRTGEQSGLPPLPPAVQGGGPVAKMTPITEPPGSTPTSQEFALRCTVVHCSVVQCSAVKHGAVHGAVNCSAVQCSAGGRKIHVKCRKKPPRNWPQVEGVNLGG